MADLKQEKLILSDLADWIYYLTKYHTHAVGECYRCDTVIEPRVSRQWFVKMKPLAEKLFK